MNEWTLTLPWTKPPLTLNARHHWATRANLTKTIRRTVHYLARNARITPQDRIHVTLTYTPAANRSRDRDNLVATLKPCIDGLVDAGVVPDDTPDYVTWEPPVITTPNREHSGLTLTIRTAP